MADLGYGVYVTKGELAVIMGTMAYGMARVTLKEAGKMVAGGTIPGAAIIEALDSTTGILLDNPEIYSGDPGSPGVFEILLAEGIISQVTYDKVGAYITGQLIIPPHGGASDPKFPYLFQVPKVNAGNELPIPWVSQFITGSNSVWIDGAFIIVNTDGTCTAPGTEAL